MGVLVTGGAGYIGAHVVDALLGAGRSVVVVDDLSTGRVDRIPGVPVVRLDVASAAAPGVLADAFARWDVTAVVHLAARKEVAESFARPEWYHAQNVEGTAHVLAAMAAAGVPHLVFSSSAAVYGSPDVPSVDEDTPPAPLSPYGTTKLRGEQLAARATGSGVRSFCLRYFNVAGARSSALRDDQETNLVTTVLGRLARGEPPQVNGTDYPTPDGSCVRDLVDVRDVASAHVAALRALEADTGPVRSEVLNVGTGTGVSVLEVVRRLCALDGSEVPLQTLPRRTGDPATVVAAVARAQQRLGWRATHDLDAVLASAWSAAHGEQVSPVR
ncbi:UDP-glucose 4-epimerase GalE [Cellulomonas sp. zg-ZUI222]|uniref:UDP-glucose 4-epimerase GalE n=1 Tax=Cellulomonas TaxID=1707 RepID=UPI001A950A7D|nr:MULTISPECIES: UDP-glucose 4-epimerase GalE [Cellulomonas]MBO0898988.1 UDP-glucose 4-epimerase GalE [Cellulomonas sp. zg-ZUI22]MBO0919840.1 UDP-glucose 4-epimerase GalE [Cellulomonas wangleii]